MTLPIALDALIPAPFGFIGVYCHADNTHSAAMDEIHLLQHALPVRTPVHPRAAAWAAQIEAYLADPHAPLQAALPAVGTPFQQRVWQAMRAIPVGQTLSYGALAAQLGSGPRAVANACGANRLPLFNPCHRVVAQHGLGGFMQGHPAGLAIKHWLLAHEQQPKYTPR